MSYSRFSALARASFVLLTTVFAVSEAVSAAPDEVVKLHEFVVAPSHYRDRRDLALATFRHEWIFVPTERILARAGVEVKSGDARYRYAYSRQRVAS